MKTNIEIKIISIGAVILLTGLALTSIISGEERAIHKQIKCNVPEEKNVYFSLSNDVFNCALCCDYIDIKKDKAGHEFCMAMCLQNGRCMGGPAPDHKPFPVIAD